MEFDYSLEAINKIAKMVTSQKGCLDDVFIDRDDLIKILHRLYNRQKKLKEALGIKNRSQLKNRKYYRLHHQQDYNIDKKLFRKLLDNGDRIQDICLILKSIKDKKSK